MNAALLDAAKSALRVWVFTTIGLWIPGLLGWINEVTKWADQKGAPAFPDPSNLAYLFVAALTAAFPAAVTGIVRFAENAVGHSALPRAAQQPVPLTTQRNEAGQTNIIVMAIVLALAVVVFVVIVRALL